MISFIRQSKMEASELKAAYLRQVEKARLQGVCLPADKVEVRDAVRLRCQIPLCKHYGNNRVCPPFAPPLADFRRALADYELAFLLKLEVPLTKGRSREGELALDDFVFQSESWAFGQGCYWAFGLVGGACFRCESCDLTRPCPHPYRPRPAPEGMGIDITHLAREAGMAVVWPPGEHRG